jgi:hypothetical protein
MQAVIFSPPKTEDGVPGLWCWPGFIGDVKDVDSCTHNPSLSLSLSLSLGARVSLANRSSFLITSSSTLSIFFFYFPCSSRINPDVNPPSPGRALFIPVDCGLSKRRHLLSNASLQRALHLDGVTPPAAAAHLSRTFNPSHLPGTLVVTLSPFVTFPLTRQWVTFFFPPPILDVLNQK